MTQRHFEKDEFPRRCDHCPAPLVAGTRYRKVLTVLDSGDSFVGGDAALVEESFELVFCSRCFERLSRWLQNPLSEIPPEGEPPAELDEAELEEELEKELFILGDGGEGLLAAGSLASGSGSGKPDTQQPASQQASSGCVLHPGNDDLVCYECSRHRQGLGASHDSSCHCPECAPCKHHPGVDCECFCRFGTCGTDTCPVDPPADTGLFTSVSESFRADEGGPCLDPDKMLGAADQFPGSDYDDYDPGPWVPREP